MQDEIRYLNSLLYFLGYGNPNEARIFVFGLEEKLTDNNIYDDKIKQIYLSKYNGKPFYLTNEEIYDKVPELQEKFNSESEKSHFYKTIAVVCNNVLKRTKEIKPKELGSEKLPVFLGNYWFISRKGLSTSYTEIEKESFEENIGLRKRILRSFIARILDKNKSYLLTFGAIRTFRHLFDSADFEFEEIHFHNNLGGRGKFYYKAKGKNIYLFYHPSFNWLSLTQINSLSFN